MGDVWLSVLGPLRVTVGQREVELRSEMQTRLLAVLICSANRSVASRTLVDALWDDPPISAAENIRKYVALLRKAIGRERIVRDRVGYRLVLHDAECDALVFQGLVDEAEALGEERMVDAERCLVRALGLWRGPAYAGTTDIGLIRPTAERLEEARATAVERRVEVGLALGRHEALVPELASFVAEFPLRERLRKQWMLALYRSGREADALDVYRQWSKLLDEELGLRPGQEIKDLEHAILNQDGGLDWTNSARDHRAPAELPFDVASTFTGRAPAVARLRRLLTQESSAPVVVSAIFGTGGIGKSALAIHVGHQIADLFPDGQLYVNLHGSTPDVEPLTPAEALARLLRSLGVAESLLPDNVEELAARFRSATSGKRLLVVLDNALDEAQVAPLLPASPTTRVLITSRQPLADLDDARHERLDVLSKDDAFTLLGRLIGWQRVDADSDASKEIVGFCDGLPLAICIAAARLRKQPTWSVSELAHRLRLETGRLGEMETRGRAIRASFMVSYSSLNQEVRRCFRLAGLLDVTEITVQLTAAMTELPKSSAREALDSLVEAQLLENHVADRYRMHDLLRLFARERAAAEDDEHERTLAVERGVHFYIATCRAASRSLVPVPRTERLAAFYPEEPVSSGLPFDDRRAAMEWSGTEAEAIVQAVQQAMCIRECGPWLAMGAVAASLTPLWYRGRFDTLMRLGQLADTAAETTGEARHRALAHSVLGIAHLNYRQHSHALCALEKARAGYQKLGDQSEEAYQLSMLGATLSRLGRHDEAERLLTRAVRLSQESGDRASEHFGLNEFGMALRRGGRLLDALSAHERAQAISPEIGLPDSFTLGAMGSLRRMLGNLDESIRLFESGLGEAEVLGESESFTNAAIRWRLGQAYFDRGQRERARKCWQESAEVLHNLNLITLEERTRICAEEYPTPLEVIERLLPDLVGTGPEFVDRS